MIGELSYSHLGILSPAAIRRALRLMYGPVDLICLDFRKLHDWNELLGYDVANVYFSRFARTRQMGDDRPADTRGQWGGDEIVIACRAGDGQGLLQRLVQALDELTAELAPDQRTAMAERTGGLLSGFGAVFCLIKNSSDPLNDAARGVTECGVLKAGPITSCRSTSGKPGTIVGSLPALAASPPIDPLPDDFPGTDDENGTPQPRAFSLQSIAIEAKIATCPYCQSIHHIQRCPELRSHLRASDSDWRIAVGRKLCAMRWRDFSAFVGLLMETSPSQLASFAESYITFIRLNNERSDLTTHDVLSVWGRIISDSGDRGPAAPALRLAA